MRLEKGPKVLSAASLRRAKHGFKVKTDPTETNICHNQLHQLVRCNVFVLDKAIRDTTIRAPWSLLFRRHAHINIGACKGPPGTDLSHRLSKRHRAYPSVLHALQTKQRKSETSKVHAINGSPSLWASATPLAEQELSVAASMLIIPMAESEP